MTPLSQTRFPDFISQIFSLKLPCKLSILPKDVQLTLVLRVGGLRHKGTNDASNSQSWRA